MTKVTRAIFNKKVPVSKSRSGTFLAFGEGNVFPNKLLEVAEDSVTAGACIDVITEFIQGNGFNDEALADFVVNRDGETMDDILGQVAENIATFQAVTLHFGFNGLGQISSIRSVSGEAFRFGTPDDRGNINYGGIFPFLDNPYYKDKKEKHTRCPLFDPRPEVVLDQMYTVGGIDKYYGQLMYAPIGKRKGGFYVVPTWYRGIKDIQTEAKLSNYDFQSVANGFSVSGFVVGLEDDVDDDEDEIEEEEGGPNPFRDRQREHQQAQRSNNDLVSQIESLQGDEEAGSVLVVTYKTKEQVDAFKFANTTGADLADRYNATNDRVPTRIARSFNVPNELVNIRRQGGIMFSPEEYRFAAQLEQGKQNRIQRKLEQMFRRIFQYWHEPVPFDDFTIENLSYFQEQAAQNAGSTTQEPVEQEPQQP